MKNKHLLSLLVVPFLLTGCGGGSKNVLTDEQIEKLTVTTPFESQSEVKKVHTVTVPKEATMYGETPHNQFGAYRLADPEVDKYVFFSFLTGKTVFELSNVSNVHTFSPAIIEDYKLYDVYGIEALDITYSFEDEAKPGTYNYHQVVIDALGNTLIEYRAKDDTVDFNFATQQINTQVYNNYDKEVVHRYVLASYLDPKTTKIVENIFEYDEKFSSAKKVEDFYATTVKEESYSTRKFVQEKKGETVEYFVRPYTVNEGTTAVGRGYEVTHAGEEGTVSQKYYVPQGAQPLVFDHHIIYQINTAIDDHDLEYDFTTGGNCYKHETYVIDMLEGTTKQVEFPYIIYGGHSIDEPVANGEIAELSKYAFANLSAIREDKTVAPEFEVRVIDSELELHENVGHLTELVKVGNNYINKSATDRDIVIYNADKLPVKTLEGVRANRIYSKCVVVKQNNNARYGLIDENGNYLVYIGNAGEVFNNIAIVSKDIIRFYSSITGNSKFYNVETLKEVKLEVNEKSTYVNSEINYGFRLEKGEDVAGSKDKVLFLNEVLGTYDRDAARTLTRRALIDFAPTASTSEYRVVYESVKTTDDDGTAHFDVYRAELLR